MFNVWSLAKKSNDVAHFGNSEQRIRAERRLGEMLKDAPKNEGALLRGTELVPRDNAAPTLAEIGVSKKQSSKSQKIAPHCRCGCVCGLRTRRTANAGQKTTPPVVSRGRLPTVCSC